MAARGLVTRLGLDGGSFVVGEVTAAVGFLEVVFLFLLPDDDAVLEFSSSISSCVIAGSAGSSADRSESPWFRMLSKLF